jgi:ribosomal protein S8
LPKKHTIKYKELLKLKYKESEIILNIINTDKGIISDKEVLQNYSGGFPIIKIV